MPQFVISTLRGEIVVKVIETTVHTNCVDLGIYNMGADHATLSTWKTADLIVRDQKLHARTEVSSPVILRDIQWLTFVLMFFMVC